MRYSGCPVSMFCTELLFVQHFPSGWNLATEREKGIRLRYSLSSFMLGSSANAAVR